MLKDKVIITNESIYLNGSKRTIVLPPIGDPHGWQEAPRNEAHRFRSEEDQRYLQEALAAFYANEDVVIPKEKYLRAAYGFQLFYQDNPVFGRFDYNHPNSGLMQTPHAGVAEIIDQHPEEKGFQEFSEECRMETQGKIYAPVWTKNGNRIYDPHLINIERYCDELKNPPEIVELPIQPKRNMNSELLYTVQYGDVEFKDVFVAFEPDIYAFDVIFPVEMCNEIPNMRFSDGEWLEFDGGYWRNGGSATQNRRREEVTYYQTLTPKAVQILNYWLQTRTA